MSHFQKVAVYFVASPLQYLAARRIAEHFESGARQVLVWYKPGLKSIINAAEWDACSYMPWPRLEPLPGVFGRHRRLRANIRMVADLVGSCDTLVLHSAVFDTEAINYFLHALPAASGAQRTYARILPDGLISIRRYPLTMTKRLVQRIRKLRRLFAPELDYQCFSGDRIGSDAAFCDRIYVLPSLPNEYPAEKVCLLPPLVDASHSSQDRAKGNGWRALVIGQPLTDTGLLSARYTAEVTAQIREWLAQQGITDIDYKAHPKDPAKELYQPDYRLVDPACALEAYMASTHYDVVIGVRSSALLFARQIYPESVKVLAFGWDRVRFKSKQEQADMKKAFSDCGVEFV
ncbi:polysialyltransferase family glycosyltransferase [Noviherbaspirillum massiliense]|uniref:polysialyltransferase family glycosyltransferase n=1 Tax=Noviherbaspirillum massiliense TaxID=1465823 RepID=UPI00031D7C6A|nr:polysialyltransferase family glycosyltransferase [Noviherbaspirillum massiliense]